MMNFKNVATAMTIAAAGVAHAQEPASYDDTVKECAGLATYVGAHGNSAGNGRLSMSEIGYEAIENSVIYANRSGHAVVKESGVASIIEGGDVTFLAGSTWRLLNSNDGLLASSHYVTVARISPDGTIAATTQDNSKLAETKRDSLVAQASVGAMIETYRACMALQGREIPTLKP